MKRVYLDHAASTPLCPAAREAMLPWLAAEGNPSSLHAEGRAAKDAIDQAREQLSQKLGCLFGEVVFTSGATEAANLAILGATLARPGGRRNRVLASAAEHPCVLQTAPLLAKLGVRLEAVPVDRWARTDLNALEKTMGDDVLMVAAMHANNEVGTIQDPRAIAEIAHRHGALFFCDAVQTFGWKQFTVDELGADLLSVSAHKLHGPKGAGALYVRSGTPLQPLAVGGGQEREVRAGTENVAAIGGFGAALDALPTPEESASAKARARAAFLSALKELDCVTTADGCPDMLAGHLHLRIPGLKAETMLIALDRLGVACGSGSACSSGSLEPSHVLLALGLNPVEAQEGLRFTFGVQTTIEDAEWAAAQLLVGAKRANFR